MAAKTTKSESSFIHFRVIFFPFKTRIRTKFVTFVTLMIALCSVAFKTYGATKFRFSSRISNINRLPVSTDHCALYSTNEERFVRSLIRYCIWLWLPMFIVTLLHIAMFLKLKQQRAKIRAASTSSIPNCQMQRTLIIFLVVVFAFLTCSFPLSILNCIKYRHPHFHKLHLVNLRNYCIPLAYLQSCLNPFIYSKIHLKIYRSMRWARRGIKLMSTTISRKFEIMTSQKENSSTYEWVSNNSEYTVCCIIEVTGIKIMRTYL